MPEPFPDLTCGQLPKGGRLGHRGGIDDDVKDHRQTTVDRSSSGTSSPRPLRSSPQSKTSKPPAQQTPGNTPRARMTWPCSGVSRRHPAIHPGDGFTQGSCSQLESAHGQDAGNRHSGQPRVSSDAVSNLAGVTERDEGGQGLNGRLVAIVEIEGFRAGTNAPPVPRKDDAVQAPPLMYIESTARPVPMRSSNWLLASHALAQSREHLPAGPGSPSLAMVRPGQRSASARRCAGVWGRLTPRALADAGTRADARGRAEFPPCPARRHGTPRSPREAVRPALAPAVP